MRDDQWSGRDPSKLPRDQQVEDPQTTEKGEEEKRRWPRRTEDSVPESAPQPEKTA
jgi:hypothetical protein